MKSINHIFIAKGRTIRKVMGGGGGGEFSVCTNFFFAHCLCRIFFFSWTPLHNFFFRQILLFFLTVKSWFIIYVFVANKLFYTHNRSMDTGHFNAKYFRKCTHSESSTKLNSILVSINVTSLYTNIPQEVRYHDHMPCIWHILHSNTPYTNTLS